MLFSMEVENLAQDVGTGQSKNAKVITQNVNYFTHQQVHYHEHVDKARGTLLASPQ